MAKPCFIYAMTNRNYYIFISHSWKYNEHQKIIEFFDDTPDFGYRDYSVPIKRSLYIKNKTALKEALYNRIKLSQIVLISTGMEVNYREFLSYELETAVEMNKPIVGIIPRGQKIIPRRINEVACDIVGWCRKTIIRSIENHSL